MKLLATSLTLCLLAQTALGMSFAQMFPQYQDLPPEASSELERLDYKQGEITVGDGIATFNVSEDYYFLSTKDANIVLEEFWGNPPESDILGMIFPADATPLHDDWGLVIYFSNIGYVSDEDVTEYNYDALLEGMQQETRDENAWRIDNGYPELDLVGWAEPPEYDSASRKLYWAKEFSGGGTEENTLNFDIRALGRKGVLVLTFIASMAQLDNVNAAIPDILAMSKFTEGNRYGDFNPSIDKIAAVGIGGLIAGKVVAKTGLIVLLLAFLKKGAFLLVVPVMWVVNRFKAKSDN